MMASAGTEPGAQKSRRTPLRALSAPMNDDAHVPFGFAVSWRCWLNVTPLRPRMSVQSAG